MVAAGRGYSGHSRKVITGSFHPSSVIPIMECAPAALSLNAAAFDQREDELRSPVPPKTPVCTESLNPDVVGLSPPRIACELIDPVR